LTGKGYIDGRESLGNGRSLPLSFARTDLEETGVAEGQEEERSGRTLVLASSSLTPDPVAGSLKVPAGTINEVVAADLRLALELRRSRTLLGSEDSVGVVPCEDEGEDIDPERGLTEAMQVSMDVTVDVGRRCSSFNDVFRTWLGCVVKT
jgi:hypothetical protein